MRNWLIDEPPLLLPPKVATVLGVNEALFLQQVHFWLSIQRVGQEVDGRRWVYNSIRAWREENFPFWSESTIKRVVAGLEDTGILLSRQLDENPLNHTKWYSIDYEVLDNLMRQVFGDDDWFNLNRSKQRLLEAGDLKKDHQRGRRSKKGSTLLVPPDQPPPASDEDAAGTRRAAKEAYLKDQEMLADTFSQISGVPRPTPVSKRDWSEYTVRWLRPLRVILEMTQTVGNATALMGRAVEQMRADSLTIASPQSIEKVAISLFAQEQGGNTGDVYW